MVQIKFPCQELSNLNFFINIASLQDYIEIVQAGIEQKTSTEAEKIKNLSAKVEDEKTFQELCFQEDIFEKENINFFKGQSNCSRIENTATYSIITMCYMLFETNLSEIARIVENYFYIDVKFNELHGGKIEKIKKYLSKFTDINISKSTEWNTLKDLELIRNCIVHNEGIILDNMKNHKQVVNTTKKYKGNIFIEEPIYSNQRVLVIKFSLCEKFIKSLYTFFDNLLEKLGFNRHCYVGAKASQQFLNERGRAKAEYDKAVKKARSIYNTRLGIQQINSK